MRCQYWIIFEIQASSWSGSSSKSYSTIQKWCECINCIPVIYLCNYIPRYVSLKILIGFRGWIRLKGHHSHSCTYLLTEFGPDVTIIPSPVESDFNYARVAYRLDIVTDHFVPGWDTHVWISTAIVVWPVEDNESKVIYHP